MEFFEYAFYHTSNIEFSHEIVYLLLALCIILPMTLINNITHFAKYNLLSNVFNVFK